MALQEARIVACVNVAQETVQTLWVGEVTGCGNR